MPVNHDSQIQHDIRTRELMQSWFNEHDVNPEIHVWGDDDVKLVSESDLNAVAQLLEVDPDDVNTALVNTYAGFCDRAEEQIREETKQSEPLDQEGMRESWLHTWEGKDGFYYCFSGTNKEGLYSESEDVGPHLSREDARENALESIDETNV